MRPTLEDEWDLEPCDDDPDGVDAHYIRESSEPEIDDEGREIWLYDWVLCGRASAASGGLCRRLGGGAAPGRAVWDQAWAVRQPPLG